MKKNQDKKMEFYIRKKINDIFENIKISILSSSYSDDFGMFFQIKIENSTGFGTYNVQLENWVECSEMSKKFKIYDTYDDFELLTILYDRINIEYGMDNYLEFLIEFMNEEDYDKFTQELSCDYLELYDQYWYKTVYPTLTVNDLGSSSNPFIIENEYYYYQTPNKINNSDKLIGLPEGIQDMIKDKYIDYDFIYNELDQEYNPSWFIKEIKKLEKELNKI